MTPDPMELGTRAVPLESKVWTPVNLAHPVFFDAAPNCLSVLRWSSSFVPELFVQNQNHGTVGCN